MISQGREGRVFSPFLLPIIFFSENEKRVKKKRGFADTI